MRPMPLRDDITPVALVTWPESDGGGTSAIGFADGLFFLDGLAPMDDPSLLEILDSEGAVTWLAPSARDWYYASRETNAAPSVPPPGAVRISGLASALLVFGYSATAWTCMRSVALFVIDDIGHASPFSAALDIISYPGLTAAIVFGWTADFLISESGQGSKGRAIVIGGRRFFHGPVMTAALAVLSLIAIIRVGL